MLGGERYRRPVCVRPVRPGLECHLPRPPIHFPLVAPPTPVRRAWRRIRNLVGRGEFAVTAPFAVAVFLLALGAAAVWRAGVRHRRTADEALSDQASYIAGQIASSVADQLWVAARTQLRAWSEVMPDGDRWPTLDSVRRRADAENIGPELPKIEPIHYFAGDMTTWRALPSDSAHDAALATLVRANRDSVERGAALHMLVLAGTHDTTLVFAMPAEHPRAGARWLGFEMPVEQLRDKLIRPRLQSLGMSFDFLRDSLRESAQAGDDPPVAVEVVGNERYPLFTTRQTPSGPWMGRRWLMSGLSMTIALSLEPAAVPVLMPTGYPTDSWPAILVAFTFGVLLLLAAARLTRRTLALSRQREEFTSSVSHELRTPLTNIQLFAETLLLDRARTPEERRSALETITRETRRLVHMVENVLALSRVGRPAETLVRRPERVDQLVRDVIAAFEPMIRAHGATVEFDCAGPETAWVDGDAVRRILINLLDNALRYGPPSQTLRVTADHAGDTLRLSVEDQGPGVPEDDRDRIWRPFERGRSQRDSGTGIGLAVVHQLVQLHGGAARVEDGARGARFVVILPRTGPLEA